jgi:hypothetical protein
MYQSLKMFLKNWELNIEKDMTLAFKELTYAITNIFKI